MKKHKGTGLMLWLTLAAALLSGCSGVGGRAGKASYTAAPMEETPVIDYTVPRMTPNILVDIEGYQADSEKEAAVKGRTLPEEFPLINAETGEAVYSGEIKSIAFNKETEVYTGYLDFGEYKEEGTYYLECDIVGRSLSFAIRKEMYQQLYEELSGEVMDACRNEKADALMVMELLLVCERYPGILQDENADGIPDALEAVGQWIQHREKSAADTYEGPLYAALLAKFSYLYQNYNLKYATQCLQKASAVFEQTRNTMKKDAENFLALTELFRATGLNSYGNQILDYRTYFENNSSYLEEPGYLYGIMTYLATRQRVDRELCSIFMENLMDGSEEISNRYGELIHPVHAQNNGVEDLLEQAEELSCANYVLNNYQYTNIIEKILHYLMGTNLESVNFYASEEASREGYLLLFAQLAAVSGER